MYEQPSFNMDTNYANTLQAHLENESYPDTYDYNVITFSNHSLYDLVITEDIKNEIRNSFYQYNDKVIVVLICLYVISFIWGFIGNILVIHVFTNTRKMRTVTNAFLVNLAISDLLVVCLCMPFTVAKEVYQSWIYGLAWCKMVNFFQGVSVISSILTLTVISAERFYAINHPIEARSFMSRKRVAKIILAIWICSCFAVFPTLIVRSVDVQVIIDNVSINSCIEIWAKQYLRHIYNFSLLIILYVGPVLFICIGYLRIGKNLWHTDANLFASKSVTKSGSAAEKNVCARKKVAKMLYVIALLFALSWLPYNIMAVTLDFLPTEFLNEHGQLLGYIFVYCTWLGHSNSSINPICYCIMSQSFKHAFNQEFKLCCRKHRFQRKNTSVSTNSFRMTLTSNMTSQRIKRDSIFSKERDSIFTSKRDSIFSKRDSIFSRDLSKNIGSASDYKLVHMNKKSRDVEMSLQRCSSYSISDKSSFKS